MNPQSAGYNQQVWNCVCEKCNRIFTVSSQQYDIGSPVTCCYCGQVQDPRLARNRGKYSEQQASAMNNQVLVTDYLATRKQHEQEATQYQQQVIQNYISNSRGKSYNPINVRIKD